LPVSRSAQGTGQSTFDQPLSPSHAIADEMFFGRPEKAKAFISSKMRDGALKKERLAVAKEIEVTRLAKAWYWERDGFAAPVCARKICVGHAGTSELLILIIEDEITPITLAEYRAAKVAGAFCCILLREGVERSAKTQAFVEAEREGYTTRPFRNLSELKTEVQRSIRACFVYSLRSDILSRRVGSRTKR
jgi:hypothetical protein